MKPEKALDNLIEAGWNVLNTDFDTLVKCVSKLMGDDHTYIDYFKSFVHGGSEREILAGAGILNVTKEQLHSQDEHCSLEHSV